MRIKKNLKKSLKNSIWDYLNKDVKYLIQSWYHGNFIWKQTE